jgi:Zn-dependent protease
MIPIVRGFVAMQKLSGNGIHLFRLFGIDVFLHWSWVIVAVYELQLRWKNYQTPIWNVAEYLTLFGIVLLHEFGHALACRSVGGVANRIMLWPLGGVAYVNPPPRAGALLWSIVAGPLVNVVLLPITIGLYFAVGQNHGDLSRFVKMIAMINGLLLGFNLLPIYPLDGGQIVRALLWFVFGRANSLLIASVIGVIGAAGLGACALYLQDYWFGFIALFALMQCVQGFQQARSLRQLINGPRHDEFACPYCQNPPPAGPLWRCSRCGSAFDTFDTRGTCPQCAATYDTTMCFHCGRRSPMPHWVPSSAPVAQPLAEPYTPPEVQIP